MKKEYASRSSSTCRARWLRKPLVKLDANALIFSLSRARSPLRPDGVDAAAPIRLPAAGFAAAADVRGASLGRQVDTSAKARTNRAEAKKHGARRPYRTEM